jgi:hypothetical protein
MPLMQETVPITLETQQSVDQPPSEASLITPDTTETITLEPAASAPVVELPAWKTALVRDEDDGSQGFLTAPWTMNLSSQTYEQTRELAREGNARSATGRRIVGAFSKTLRKGSDAISLHLEEAGGESYWNGVMAGLKGIVGVDVESISTVPVFAVMWRAGTHSSSYVLR